MKIFSTLLVSILLGFVNCFAQHEADNWFFGNRAGMSFQNGTPVQIADGKLSTEEGCAVMSDKVTGKLLFYTDGSTVWNGNHTVVTTDLRGGISGSQTALIVPNPANNLEYYIFTTPDLTAGGEPKNTALYYSLISVATPDCEMLLKNVFLIDSVSEKLTGTLDCAETGYWIVTQDVSKNFFYSFHITSQGVNRKHTVSFYDEIPMSNIQGCMKLSPDGTKLAVTSSLAKTPFLALFDFNRLTGEATNYNLLSNPNTSISFYGISFSPDNKILFATGKTGFALPLYFSGLFQYDVTVTPSAVKYTESMLSVRFLIPYNNSTMQLAPDGKLYVVSGNRNFVDIINNPNIKGVGCNYQADAINFQKFCGRGLPNFMDYLFGDHCFYRSCNSSGNGDTIIICPGTNIQIGNRPISGFSYSWTPTEGLNNPNISNPIASPVQTTAYTLKLTSVSCESFQTFIVKIAEKPVIASVPPICTGESVQLSVTRGDSYSWTPAIDFDTATKANPIVTPKETTLYKVIVTQGHCIDSAFVTIKVFPKFTANAGEDQRICLSESVQIGDTAKEDETYFWYPPEGLDDVTSPNPIATPKGTTRYIVVTKRNGCIAYDTVLVTVIIVKPVVSKDVTICKGTSAQLTSSGGKVYSWSPAAGLNNPRIANPVATPLATTKYRVRISNGNCIDSAFVTVNILPSFKANAGMDQTLCFGASTELGELPEQSKIYSWLPTTNLNDSKKANPICTPRASTKYILTVTNENGCKEYDTVLVTVKNQNANAGADKTICTGSKTQLGTPPESGNIYSWEPSSNLDDPTKSDPVATPNSTTQYILKVTSNAGCVGYDTVLVTVSNNLIAKVSGDTSICNGTSVQLSASGGSEYEWSPITGLDNPYLPNPIASPSKTIAYKVRVLSGICKDSTSVTVTVNPPPTAIAGPDLSSCKGETLLLGVPSQAGNIYLWNPAIGLDDPTKSNPKASPTATTNYILTVINSLGCSAVDSVLVSIGTINAVVSADTTVCEGSSIRLSASGGSSYQWSPTAGLDNPALSNPLCSPDSSTVYKVIVSDGSCIDSAFIMVGISPLPIVNAGQDKVICFGDGELIGTVPKTGDSYSWSPISGLSTPLSSQTVANPQETTSYVLKVTNSQGCEKKDTVLVIVNPTNERLFTLNPSIISALPGQQFKTLLQIPKNVHLWNVHLTYDNLIMKFNSLILSTNGIITSVPNERNGQLSLNGSGENGTITFLFNSFLPYNSDTSFVINLTVDSVDDNLCTSIISHGNTLVFDIFCGRTIRSISSTGKNYFLINKENGINFGVGLSGNVRLELYDYTGTLKEVLQDGKMDAGEYSLDFELPTGVYFCRINAGMYNDVQKILISKTR